MQLTSEYGTSADFGQVGLVPFSDRYFKPNVRNQNLNFYLMELA